MMRFPRLTHDDRTVLAIPDALDRGNDNDRHRSHSSHLVYLFPRSLPAILPSEINFPLCDMFTAHAKIAPAL